MSEYKHKRRNRINKILVASTIIGLLILVLYLIINLDLSYEGYIVFARIYDIVVSSIGITAVIAIATLAITIGKECSIIRRIAPGALIVLLCIIIILAVIQFNGHVNFEYDYGENYIYRGQALNHKAEGHGVLYDSVTHRTVYEGAFKSNMFYGKGVLYELFNYEDGHEENGIKYIGDFKYNRKSGSGIEYTVFEDDYYICYDGEYDDGVYCGQGKWYNSYDGKQTLRYEGEFRNGMYNGQGTMYYYDDDLNIIEIYNGYFSDNRRNGKGTLYQIVNGEKVVHYNGYFRDNFYYGNGELYEIKDNGYYLQYEGSFVDGYYQGNGIYYRENGSYFKGAFQNGNFLEGEYNAGVIDGYSVSYRCEGSFSDWELEGWCKEYWDDVFLFEGYFHEGIRNGEGFEYDHEGNIVYHGYYENGLKNGDGKERNNEGEMVEVTYVKGQKVNQGFNVFVNVERYIQGDVNAKDETNEQKNINDTFDIDCHYTDCLPYHNNYQSR